MSDHPRFFRPTDRAPCQLSAIFHTDPAKFRVKVPRDDRTVVRFWHLWGSSPDARSRVTGSSRDSPYRDPQLLESRVRALARVFDERSGLDVPARIPLESKLSSAS